MGNPLVSPTGVVSYAAPSANTGVNNTQPSVSGSFVIDGTPVRVAALGLAAGLLVFSLRKSGFKFNVGVS